MSKLRKISLIVQAVMYMAAGANHFLHSGTYVAIVPPHYAQPLAWVQFTGLAEVLGGIGLLVPPTRRAAAWSIIAMLLVYFDVHIYMIQHADRFASIPMWALYARLPLQLLLIAWAWMYTRPQSKA